MTRRKSISRKKSGGRRQESSIGPVTKRGNRRMAFVLRDVLEKDRNIEVGILVDSATKSVIKRIDGKVDKTGIPFPTRSTILIGRPLSIHTHPGYGDALPSIHDVWAWVSHAIEGNPEIMHGVAQKVWVYEGRKRRKAHRISIFDPTKLSDEELKKIHKKADLYKRMKSMTTKWSERVALEESFNNTPEMKLFLSTIVIEDL